MQTLSTPAQRENLPKVLRFIKLATAKAGVKEEDAYRLELCAEEIFLNICSHAYTNGVGKASIRVKQQKDTFTVCFEDGGVPFNPLVRPLPRLDIDAEQRSPGGLGVVMIKHYFPDAIYQRDAGRNLLWLTVPVPPKSTFLSIFVYY